MSLEQHQDAGVEITAVHHSRGDMVLECFQSIRLKIPCLSLLHSGDRPFKGTPAGLYAFYNVIYTGLKWTAGHHCWSWALCFEEVYISAEK